MPLIIALLFVAVVSALLLPRRTALILTAVLAAATVVAHVWAVMDGVGDDPWWLVLVAAVSALVAFGLVEGIARRRTVTA